MIFVNFTRCLLNENKSDWSIFTIIKLCYIINMSGLQCNERAKNIKKAREDIINYFFNLKEMQRLGKQFFIFFVKVLSPEILDPENSSIFHFGKFIKATVNKII